METLGDLGGATSGNLVEAEIAELLDQCSPEEIECLLQSLGDGAKDQSPKIPCSPIVPTRIGDAEVFSFDQPRGSGMVPVAPSQPPPQGETRRPKASGPRHSESDPKAGQGVSIDDIKHLMSRHTDEMLGEVRKMMTVNEKQEDAGGSDMETLAMILAERDREVHDLETCLAELQSGLSTKEKRVEDLRSDLEMIVMEVKHRQLDLEFQQTKLGDRLQSNLELEQAKNLVSTRALEATLDSKHAAIELGSVKGPLTPRGVVGAGVRVQGALPWAIRKHRVL